MKNNIKLGSIGENIAEDYLKKKGFKIIDRNWRFSRLGELDIIASKDNFLVFVEVKTRTSTNFGHPLESINKAKFNTMQKLAQVYIDSVVTGSYSGYRFDIIGIIMNRKPEIIHYENIFE